MGVKDKKYPQDNCCTANQNSSQFRMKRMRRLWEKCLNEDEIRSSIGLNTLRNVETEPGFQGEVEIRAKSLPSIVRS